MKTQITQIIKPTLAISIAAFALIGWCSAARAHDDDQLIDSKPLLTVCADTYWRWAYGNGNVVLPTDQNGNTVLGGIVFMPLPDNSTSTTGKVDVTVRAEQDFFLPLFVWLGTSYSDGTPPDPFFDFKAFKKSMQHFKLKIDGHTVLDEDDASDFFLQFSFDPPIPFEYPPNYKAIIFHEGIGILHKGLSPGKHVIQLDEKFNQPAPNFGGAEYHNTFNVIVQP